MSLNRKLKAKKCGWCGTEFIPFSSLSKTCSVECAIEKLKYKQETQLQRDIKAFKQSERKDIRKRKDKLKSRSAWLKDAQDNAFNPYIRKRDEGRPCISCGKSEAELKIKSPIAMVCGHYLSVGAYPELRFNELNANLQCTRCNGGAGKYGQFNSKALTVTQEYRVRLIDKIGIDSVTWLEGKQQAQKYIIEDIKEIKAYYKEQMKRLNDS